MKYQTTAAYVSGAICGDLWMPQTLAGKPVKIDLEREMKRFNSPATFRDVLLSILMEQGGDFLNAEFSEDSIIRIERTTDRRAGTYSVHVKEIPISRIEPDLVREDVLASDFF